MTLYLHNTLTKKKELFSAEKKDEVTMYNCGPTVYNFAHIGNLRAYVFVDILRRTLEHSGYKVKQVMNITDVGHLTSDGDDGDDKMVKALKREGKPFTLHAMREVADFYAKAFKEDLTALNIKIPETLEHASDHIPEDINLIKKLETKGFTYKTSDGVYFDTSKFPSYGKLGNINLEGQLAGARVAINSEKKNPVDFTLWKISNNDIGWESPWGKGFPGWHIECSAMSSRYLGQPFDIHTGGIDHIPVHHNNEIAQSEAANDVPLAHYWLHNAHLNMSSPASAQGSGEVKKMAKSGENFITLQTIIEKGFSPLSYRYYLLGANYRTPMMFSWEALDAAKKTLKFLIISLAGMPEGGKIDSDYEKKFADAIYDDLNTSEGLAVLWKFLGNNKISQADRRATICKFGEILGFDFPKLIKEHANFDYSAISDLLEERKTARASKNWKRADEIRTEIFKLGFEVKDTEGDEPIVEKL